MNMLQAPLSATAGNAKPGAWLDGVHVPCDPDVFLAVLDAWQKGASRPLKAPNKRQPGIYLADIPINRCAMAATAYMRKHGIEPAQAYLWRLMNLGLLIEAAPKHGLEGLIHGNEVHVSLLRAAALANLGNLKDEGTGFDMEDVVRYAAAHDHTEVTKNA